MSATGPASHAANATAADEAGASRADVVKTWSLGALLGLTGSSTVAVAAAVHKARRRYARRGLSAMAEDASDPTGGYDMRVNDAVRTWRTAVEF